MDRLAAGLPAALGAPVRDLAARPGKRLRPLLLAACAGFGDPDPARLVRLGALVELLHLASLLHDDVIDRADERRGGPAAHTVVGAEVATLAGLACLALVGTEAADLGGGLDRLVSRTVAELSYGELLDVERAFDTALPLPDYLELVARKTADLFRLSCLLGAAEARVTPEAAAALAAFGRELGIAFQIRDDCLDLSTTATGKPTGTDHLLGLFGAPTLYALAAAPDDALAELLLSPDLDASAIPRIRTLVAEHGGFTSATSLAESRYAEALTSLNAVPPGPARTTLTRIAASSWQAPQ
ncbi:MAG TPA: polyprenyl synthetase family protein [Streptosporangiaceae bacterium]